MKTLKDCRKVSCPDNQSMRVQMIARIYKKFKPTLNKYTKQMKQTSNSIKLPMKTLSNKSNQVI